ncbi:hypothetical protein D3C78_875140 [compost metagenome]
MIGTALADIQAISIAPAQVENRRSHQAVVEHHIGLLHQAQGTEGQQIRIARTGAHQIDLATCLGLPGFKLFAQQPFGLRWAAGKHALGDRPLEHVLPEDPPLLQLGQTLFHRLAEATGQPGELAVGRRNPGFQLGPQQPRQHWRIAAAGNRHDQRRPVDDGREDHTAQSRGIDHIDRHATRMCITGNPCIERLIVGCGDCQHAIVQVAIGITALAQLALPLLHQLAQLRMNLRSDHAQQRTGVVEQARLAQCDLTTADQKGSATAQVMEQRQVVHLSRSPRCRPCTA